jgi:uncharacterized membrane protein
LSRVVLFLLLFGTGLVLLLLTVVWYLASYQVSEASMMAQMMGSQYTGGSAMPSYVWVAIVALLVPVVGGIAGLGYYFTFPEIKRAPAASEPPAEAAGASPGPKEDWSVLFRTSKPEERKVLGLIAAHDGRYLQKFIAKDTGLSKLKTHRIVARLAERGIVSVSKSGNTNEVALAPWLKPGQSQKDPET